VVRGLVGYVPGQTRAREPCTPLTPTGGTPSRAVPKQRHLPLLGIEAHQGFHNLSLTEELPLGLPLVKLPGFDPWG